MKQLFIALLWVGIVIPVNVQTQETITVTGTVTNAETKNPIEWVTVKEKFNETNGVYTDKNGKYKIKIKRGSDLYFIRHWYDGKSFSIDSTHFDVALKPLPKEVQQEMDRRAREGGSGKQ
ncbi:carboxypeptidase-like regulatory domain-containing protein [Gelidibacter japonicus]|uniref:carboxypeptidase-like regulatory domain-containing protein n=1 Tax=Gelidibacter japonicus TaxID=1962232 RepID=UPI003A924E19